MKRILCRLFGWWSVLLLVGGLPAAEPHRHAAATVVVANANDPESIEIAEAYQAFRGIPDKNLILLPLPKSRDISHPQYVETLLNPLRAALFERTLLNGDFVGVPDALGRKPVLFVENQVRYLVLCRGVPLRIRESKEADDAEMLDTYLEAYRRQPGQSRFQWPTQYQVNRGSVDSELSLLAVNNMPIRGLVRNPLVGRAPDSPATPVVRVARLDGPSNAAVLAALDGVRTVEENGLKGRAYFDLRSIKEGSPYKMGDDWVEGARQALEPTFMDTEVDRKGATMGVATRMDAPAIYIGWYATHVVGPFSLDRFQFAPGAIAMHLHSSSGADPQSTTTHWVGPLINAGASATVGNVYEPYLTQTHQFQVILGTMLKGANFGDACYAAIPSLSWQWAVFGDPLYEPFKVTHEAMLPAALQMEDVELDPYVIMREMNRLVDAGQTMEARDLGQSMLELNPHPALALHLARLERTLGKRITARRRLEPFAETVRFRPQDWMLFVEIARELDAWEAMDEATALYRHLIDDGRQPRDIKKVLFKEGSAAALWTASADSEAWKIPIRSDPRRRSRGAPRSRSEESRRRSRQGREKGRGSRGGRGKEKGEELMQPFALKAFCTARADGA